MCDYSKKTLKQQIQISFNSIACVSMSSILLLCVLFTVFVNRRVIDDASSNLTNQMLINVNRLSVESGKVISSYFDKSINNFLNQIVFSVSVAYDKDFGIGFEPSYFNYYESMLKQPLSVSTRETGNVSLGASSYYFPNTTPLNISTFTQSQIETVNRTSYMDEYTITNYQTNDKFVSGYVGMTNGMFRRYAGKSTLSADPERLYDPRLRGWYVSAMQKPNQTVISDPYQDFFTKQWMITFAHTINSTLGVAGGDMLIVDIQKQIEDVTILKSGRMILIQDNGIVVSDKLLNLSSRITPYTYNDIKYPSVSLKNWNDMRGIQKGNSKTLEITENDIKYFVTYYKLDQYPSYIIISIITQNEIKDGIKSIVLDIDSVNKSLVVGICLGSIVLIAIVVLFVHYTVEVLLAPLDVMLKNVNKFVANIGTATNIFNGATVVPLGVTDETRTLATNFNQMVTNLNNANRTNDMIANPYFVVPTAPVASGVGLVHPVERFPDGLTPYHETDPMPPTTGHEKC